jgi:hypothetical protein
MEHLAMFMMDQRLQLILLVIKLMMELMTEIP